MYRLVKIPWHLLKLSSRKQNIWACFGQVTPLKFDEIFPLAIRNQISTISMHIPSLVKTHWCLFKLSSGNENMGASRADNSITIWQICLLAIPDQISTISMHIPSLVKIHWCLLKLSSGNEKQTDVRLTDVCSHERVVVGWLCVPSRLVGKNQHVSCTSEVDIF